MPGLQCPGLRRFLRAVEPSGEVQSDRSYLDANAALALELLNRYVAGTLALDAQEQEQEQEQDCGHEFFVNMQKRRDGRVYVDLHKTDERIYFTPQGWLTIQAVTSDGAVTSAGLIPFGTSIYGWQASARPSSTAATSKNART